MKIFFFRRKNKLLLSRKILGHMHYMLSICCGIAISLLLKQVFDCDYLLQRVEKGETFVHVVTVSLPNTEISQMYTNAYSV